MRSKISNNSVSKRMLSVVLTLCFMLMLCRAMPQVQAAEDEYDLEVYVDQETGDNATGDDSGAPFETIDAAIAYVEDQTYTAAAVYISGDTYSEHLTIHKSMRLVGASMETTIIDGGSSGRCVTIEGDDTVVTIENLTVQNGKAADGAPGTYENPNGSPGEGGGGIFSAGMLNLIDCTVSGNAAGIGGLGGNTSDYGGSGGDGGSGGGIYCAGMLTLTDCTVSGNAAGSGGSGGESEGGGLGGSGGDGGDGGSGGGIYCAGLLNLTDCTVSGNTAGKGGSGGEGDNGGDGGDGGSGGGLYCSDSQNIIACNITGNSTGNGGNGGEGVFRHGLGGDGGDGGSGGGVCGAAETKITGSRMTSNTTGSGGSGGWGDDEDENSNGSAGSHGTWDLLYARSGSADNNWWGANSKPGPDDTNLTVSKWLTLNISAIDTVSVNSTTDVTVSLMINNSDETVENIFSGGNVSFTATNGSVSPNSAALSSGGASTAYTAPASVGTGTVAASLDSESVSVNITVITLDISESSFSLIGNKYQLVYLTPVDAHGTLSWSATGLPTGLSIDAAGMISGTPTVTGDYTVQVTLTDDRGGTVLTVVKTVTVHVYEATGNGAFLVAPISDAAYTAGMMDGLIPTMTVNTGVSGFTYFSADVSAALGHDDEETAVFVQMRDGAQVGMSFVRADFENVSHIGAGFNAQAGDVVKIYIVDELKNGASENPEIL